MLYLSFSYPKGKLSDYKITLFATLWYQVPVKYVNYSTGNWFSGIFNTGLSLIKLDILKEIEEK